MIYFVLSRQKRFMCFWRFFIVFSLLFQSVLYAQTDSARITPKTFKNNLISFDYYQGKMFKIYETCPSVSNSRYVSINYQWQTTGAKLWHRSYAFPVVGLSFYYNSLGNDSILGHSLGLCPNMIIKIRGQKRWGAFVKVATGFAFFNKPYNRETNPKNLIIGSKITNMTQLSFNTFIKVTPKITLNAGYSIFHFSSGHMSIPNYGYNDLAWNVGLQFKPYNRIMVKPPKDSITQKQILFNTRFSLGYHELSGTVSPSGGPLYPIYSFSTYVSKRIGTVNNFRLGLSAKYFSGYHDFMLSEGYFTGNENAKSWVLSVLFGDEWQIGHIGFLLEPSLKFYNPFYQIKYVDEAITDKSKMIMKRWLSIKSGFSYYLLHSADKPKWNPAIGMYINTNRTQADYVDFSLSCAF